MSDDQQRPPFFPPPNQPGQPHQSWPTQPPQPYLANPPVPPQHWQAQPSYPGQHPNNGPIANLSPHRKRSPVVVIIAAIAIPIVIVVSIFVVRGYLGYSREQAKDEALIGIMATIRKLDTAIYAGDEATVRNLSCVINEDVVVARAKASPKWGTTPGEFDEIPGARVVSLDDDRAQVIIRSETLSDGDPSRKDAPTFVESGGVWRLC